MCGVKTNIVTTVEIHERHANDSKVLPALATTTAHNFTMTEVSADNEQNQVFDGQRTPKKKNVLKNNNPHFAKTTHTHQDR
jgi:hypothetical protein